MYLSLDPDDRRAEQRTRVRRELDRLVADLQRDTNPRLVLGALVVAARKLHRRLEDGDPILPRRARGRAAS